MAPAGGEVTHDFFVSDGADEFISFANSVLPRRVENTSLVDIEAY